MRLNVVWYLKLVTVCVAATQFHRRSNVHFVHPELCIKHCAARIFVRTQGSHMRPQEPVARDSNQHRLQAADFQKLHLAAEIILLPSLRQTTAPQSTKHLLNDFNIICTTISDDIAPFKSKCCIAVTEPCLNDLTHKRLHSWHAKKD
ncbi:hypothetical protein XENORESO_013788 [Xenotaenia resolanae]|uniref:Secreted protein n=1 Tax=Xenotaenia resolanae TaxID=208358 RepID=A0ABV0VRB4_9TELE